MDNIYFAVGYELITHSPLLIAKIFNVQVSTKNMFRTIAIPFLEFLI